MQQPFWFFQVRKERKKNSSTDIRKENHLRSIIEIKLGFQLPAKQSKNYLKLYFEVLFLNFNLSYAPNHEDSPRHSCWRGEHRPIRAGMSNGNTAIFNVHPDGTQTNKTNTKPKLRYDK